MVDFQAGAWVEALIEGYLAALLAAGPGQAIRRVQQVKGLGPFAAELVWWGSERDPGR